MQVFGPLEHHDYRVLDAECICHVCVPWRERHRALQEQQLKTQDHDISCACEECRIKVQRRTAYLAAMNKRDLYCEASWHAQLLTRNNNVFTVTVSDPVSGFALVFMNWLGGELNTRNDSWWEIRGLLLPLSHWFNRFSHAAAASGHSLGIPQYSGNIVAS